MGKFWISPRVVGIDYSTCEEICRQPPLALPRDDPQPAQQLLQVKLSCRRHELHGGGQPKNRTTTDRVRWWGWWGGGRWRRSRAEVTQSLDDRERLLMMHRFRRQRLTSCGRAPRCFPPLRLSLTVQVWSTPTSTACSYHTPPEASPLLHTTSHTSPTSPTSFPKSSANLCFRMGYSNSQTHGM